MAALKDLKPAQLLHFIKLERYKRSFYEWVRDFWCVVEPAVPFMEARHLKALCDHFQAVYEGRISHLNVEIGPGYAKSMIMSVLGPAWVWGPAGNPGYRFITSTQEHGLTIRDSLKFRALVYSPEYQAFWGESVKPMADNNKQDYIENTKKGFRISKSVNGKATGHRGHMVITDDTLDATDAHSDAARAAVEKHLKALSSRWVNPKKQRWINIGQRLHEEDAGGWCRKQGFESLTLPSEFDPVRACTTSIGFKDWRTEKGELLFPELYGEPELARAKIALGPYGYSAQHQQLPVPDGGGILKEAWWRDYNYAQRPAFHTIVQWWDTAFTSNEANDTSAVVTWGVGLSSAFLLDAQAYHHEMPDLLEQMKTDAAKWRPHIVLIENKANAPSLEQTLKRDKDWRWKLVLAPVTLNKTQRAHAVAPFVANGLAFVCRDMLHTDKLLTQTNVFPKGKLRDLADSAISGLLWIFSTYTFGGSLAPAFSPEEAPKTQNKNSFTERPAIEDSYAKGEGYSHNERTGLY